MKILLIGQSWLQSHFKEAGHEVIAVGFAEHLDIQPRHPAINIKVAISEAGYEFEPDVVVIWDNSAPIAVSGLDDFEVPILFYSIDTHHHSHLHQYISLFVDETWVAQKDYIECFAEVGREATWVPVWASKFAEPNPKKEYGAVFVGNMKRHLNPERVDFFEALEKKTPILVTQGDWVDIFSKAEIVVNQTVKSDLNFRVFEAMMSGVMLLTENSSNGLLELFEDGKHLVTYEKNNVDDAAEKINYYLNNPEEMHRIAHAGREHVIKHHSMEARAEWFLNRIENARVDKTKRPKNFAAAINYSVLSRQVAPINKQAEIFCLGEVLKSTYLGFDYSEEMNTDMIFNIVSSSLVYDLFTGTGQGAELLSKLRERYFENALLNLLDVRRLLNLGKVKEATALAEQMAPGKSQEIFAKVDEVATTMVHERDSLIKSQSEGERNPVPVK